MSKSVGPTPAISDASAAARNARARRALHEARREATVVLACDVALFVGLAAVDAGPQLGLSSRATPAC